MTDLKESISDGVRRGLRLEFKRMEDDFDETRHARKQITEKLMTAVTGMTFMDASGAPKEDVTDVGIRLASVALKALADTEKANAAAISLKLRQNEQETANATAQKDRITVVLEATKPGRIASATISHDTLGEKLAEMFDGEIQDFELKTNPNSLDQNDIS